MPVLVASAIVALLLIGGVAKISSGSAPYRRSVNASFAAQAAVLADRSNRSALDLRALLDAVVASSLDRPGLQQRLDALVSDTDAQGAAADRAMPPAPGAGTGEAFVSALDGRARAMTQLRSAVDGLLGMQPLAVIGASGSLPGGNAATGSSTLVPSSQVAAEMARVGGLLAWSDQDYATARLGLRKIGASPGLPRSAWTTSAGPWDAGRVATLVAQLGGSPSLLPVHQLALVGFRLQPEVLPSAGSSAPSVVPPTRSLRVTTIVSNLGNVAESDVVLSASVQEIGSAVSQSTRRTVDLAAGGSDVEVLDPLAVQAGSSYVLTVSVLPAAGRPSGSPPPQSATITVAPPTPPTTTTTTSAPTTPTSRPGTTTTRRP